MGLEGFLAWEKKGEESWVSKARKERDTEREERNGTVRQAKMNVVYAGCNDAWSAISQWMSQNDQHRVERGGVHLRKAVWAASGSRIRSEEDLVSLDFVKPESTR